VNLLLNMADVNGTIVPADSSTTAAVGVAYSSSAIVEVTNYVISNAGPFGGGAWRGNYQVTGSFSNRVIWFASNSAYALPGDFTIELWAKVHSWTTFQYLLTMYPTSSAGTTGFGPGVNIQYRSSGFAVGFQDLVDTGTTKVSLGTGAAPAADTWHHVAVTRSGNTVRLYLNGTLAQSTTMTVGGSIPAYEMAAAFQTST
jgi:hypothetical protein